MESTNKRVKVSIITTTYNNAANLQNIVNQVKKQDYKNIQYIIVNGGNDVETEKILCETSTYFGNKCKILSEPDHGIYNALNKGIKMADGDIIGCCFDEFASEDVISRMVSIIGKEGTDGVHGDLIYRKDGKTIRTWHQGQGKLVTGWMPGHPTLYLKRNIYEKYGMYKEDYKIAADYEFMVRCLKEGTVRLSYLPEVLVYMEYGGTSNRSLGAYIESFKEGHRALKENKVRFTWFTDICRTVRVLTQFL